MILPILFAYHVPLAPCYRVIAAQLIYKDVYNIWIVLAVILAKMGIRLPNTVVNGFKTQSCEDTTIYT